jgi:hypothetical protein
VTALAEAVRIEEALVTPADQVAALIHNLATALARQGNAPAAIARSREALERLGAAGMAGSSLETLIRESLEGLLADSRARIGFRLT